MVWRSFQHLALLGGLRGSDYFLLASFSDSGIRRFSGKGVLPWNRHAGELSSSLGWAARAVQPLPQPQSLASLLLTRIVFILLARKQLFDCLCNIDKQFVSIESAV